MGLRIASTELMPAVVPPGPPALRSDPRRSAARSRRAWVRRLVALFSLSMLSCMDLQKFGGPEFAAGEPPRTLGDQVRLLVRPMTFFGPVSPSPDTTEPQDFWCRQSLHVPDTIPSGPLWNLWDISPAAKGSLDSGEHEATPGAPRYEPGSAVDGAFEFKSGVGYFDGFITNRRKGAMRLGCTGHLTVELNRLSGQLSFSDSDPHSVLAATAWGGGVWTFTHGSCHRAHFGVQTPQRGSRHTPVGESPYRGPGYDYVVTDPDLIRSSNTPTYLICADMVRTSPRGGPSTAHLNLILAQRNGQLVLEAGEGVAEVAWRGYTVRRQFYFSGGSLSGSLGAEADGAGPRTRLLVPFQAIGPTQNWTTQLHIINEMADMAHDTQARCMAVFDVPAVDDRLWVVNVERTTRLPVSLYLPGADLKAAQARFPAAWSWLMEMGPVVAPVSGGNAPSLPIQIARSCLPDKGWSIDTTPDEIRIHSRDFEGVVPLSHGQLVKEEPTDVLPPYEIFAPHPREPRQNQASIVLVASAENREARTVAATLQQILRAPLNPRVPRSFGPTRWARWILTSGGAGFLACYLAGPGPAFAITAGGALLAWLGTRSYPVAVLWLLSGLIGIWGARRRGGAALRAWISRSISPGGTVDLPASIGIEYPDAIAVARGGMGVVFRATRPEDGASVIIKTIAPEFCNNMDYQRRFRREVSVLHLLDHPNIVRVLEAHLEDLPYFVMEDFRSRNLQDLLEERARLPERMVLKVGAGLASALAAAHAQAIQHRDVKPTNVLVGEDGSVKLIDFGLAWMADATRITQSAAVIGTLRYLSPETLLGQEPTPAADIYSVGVVLYECLTGTVPFAANVLLRLTYGAVLPPTQLVPGLSEATSEIVMRCLKPVGERWTSAFELEAVLKARLAQLESSPRQPAELLPTSPGF